jgi:hypothetical protein
VVESSAWVLFTSIVDRVINKHEIGVGVAHIRGLYEDLAWKCEGKSPLGRPRRRCECNIKMYVKE